MRKIWGILGILVISLFFLALLNTAIVKAQDAPGLDESGAPLVNEIQQGQEKYEQFTTAQNKSDFLKAEWGRILQKHKFIGPVLEKISKTTPVANPIFKYTTGMQPTLSWLFVLTLILFGLFAFYIKDALGFSSFSNKINLIISLIIVIIFGNLGIFVKISQKIIDAISFFFTKWWMQLIGIGIVFIGIILAILFHEKFEQLIKKWKEERKKFKQAMEIAEIKMKQHAQDEVQKALTKSFKSKNS